MQKFEFPKNIKQIGSISDGMKIYVEDYVCSYLQQYAEASGYEEALAILLGRKMLIDGQTVIFISGAVQGKYTVPEDNMQVFTETTWSYVEEQIDRYFKDMEVLGWMQTQPGYGLYLNANYAKYHFEAFDKPYQVMFVVDPVESTNVFFVKNKDKKALVESKGYFVYYDKNENMHEYMVNNKIKKERVVPEVSEDQAALYQAETDRAIRFNATKRYRGRGEQKRLVNMLVSVSGVLLVICFVMGIGLVQNGDRISRLEADLSRMSESYVMLLEVVRGDRVEEVFAEQIEQSDQAEEVGQGEETPETTESVDQITEAQDNEPEQEASIIPEDDNEVLQQETQTPPATQETTVQTPPPATQETTAQTPPPATQETSAQSIIPATYVIQAGDNLLFISLEFYGTTQMVNEIMEYNGITDSDAIQAGRVINLPPK